MDLLSHSALRTRYCEWERLAAHSPITPGIASRMDSLALLAQTYHSDNLHANCTPPFPKSAQLGFDAGRRGRWPQRRRCFHLAVAWGGRWMALGLALREVEREREVVEEREAECVGREDRQEPRPRSRSPWEGTSAAGAPATVSASASSVPGTSRMTLRLTALRLVAEHPLLSPIGAPSGTNLPFGQSPRELYAFFSKSAHLGFDASVECNLGSHHHLLT